LHSWLFGVGFEHLTGETDHYKSGGPRRGKWCHKGA
jgi:hypothetical protein